jgi:hypothetical protein
MQIFPHILNQIYTKGLMGESLIIWNRNTHHLMDQKVGIMPDKDPLQLLTIYWSITCCCHWDIGLFVQASKTGAQWLIDEYQIGLFCPSISVILNSNPKIFLKDKRTDLFQIAEL